MKKKRSNKKLYILAGIIVAAIILILTIPTKEITIKDEPPWYFPAIITIEPGTTIKWENTGAVVHPVNTLSGPTHFSSGHFTTTWQYTFDKPGIYKFFCPVHPYMQGLIGVGMNVPPEMIPKWINWPPAHNEIPAGLPPPAKGEIWLDAQFHMIKGKEKPGSIIVVDANTWQVKKIITDKRLNNPHNLWQGIDENHILQTNWFDKYLSVIDKNSKIILRHIYVGESPAHVMTEDNKIYLTLQGADGILVLDENYNTITTYRTAEAHGHGTETNKGTGPHGHWINKGIMAVAHTEGGSISIWDTKTNTKIYEHEAGKLPLMAAINNEATQAYIASHGDGNYYAFSIQDRQLITQYYLGNGPVQVVPDPTGQYILVPLSGDAEVAIIDAKTNQVIKKLPSGAGAHGVAYGKTNNGWNAYVSNKFVPWITVINMNTLEIAGYIPLPEEALGGQGILVVNA